MPYTNAVGCPLPRPLPQFRLDTIRFLQAAIKSREIELREKGGAVDDEEVSAFSSFCSSFIAHCCCTLCVNYCWLCLRAFVFLPRLHETRGIWAGQWTACECG